MDKKFKTILLKARESVYSHLSGGSLFKKLGQGYDFAELREYESSDDIRYISWINSAKLGEPYVKKMYKEQELNIALCSLLDGRFLVGKKRELLAYVVAILGYSAHEANNLFGAFTIFGSTLKRYESSKNLYMVERVIDDIAKAELLAQKVAYEKLLDIRLASKHLLVIVGDFLDDVDLSLLRQQHEVVAIVIRDEQEEYPQVMVERELIDPQSNQLLTQRLTKRAIEYYRGKLLEHDERLIEHFYRHNIAYVKVSRSEELIEKLEALFS
jgi:uncharacterized protein (DUF58 family)